MFNKKFCKLIRDRREGLKLTLRDLSYNIILKKGTCISASYLCDIESGKRKIRDYKILQELSRELNLSFPYLCYLCGLFPLDKHRQVLSLENFTFAFEQYEQKAIEALRLQYGIQINDTK